MAAEAALAAAVADQEEVAVVVEMAQALVLSAVAVEVAQALVLPMLAVVAVEVAQALVLSVLAVVAVEVAQALVWDVAVVVNDPIVRLAPLVRQPALSDGCVPDLVP